MMRDMKRLFGLTAVFIFLSTVRTTYAASITLSPGSSSETSMVVDILLDTEGTKISGVDLIVSYDKEKLSLSNVQPGTIFYTYTPTDIDKDSGRVSLSGLVQPEKSYTGSGKFAQLVFQPLKRGKANVEVVYKKGDRNDSNVADLSGNDVLTEVKNIAIQTKGKAGSGIGGFFQNLLDILIFWD